MTPVCTPLGSLQRSPRRLAVFRGPTAKRRGEEGREFVLRQPRALEPTFLLLPRAKDKLSPLLPLPSSPFF